MKWVLELAVAGLGNVFLHYGIIGIIIALGLVAELGSAYIMQWFPPLGRFLIRFQKDILWIMVIAAFGAVMMWVGGADQIKRCLAKQTVIERQVHSAVTKPHVGPNLNGETNE